MNHNLKTILALLLVLTFAAACLIGCKGSHSSSTEPEQPSSQGTEATTETTEPLRQPGVYFVTILPTANGTVTANCDQAKPGDTITLTVTPGEGYELLSLTANGAACELSFEMPAEDVSILARFGLPEEKPQPEVKVYPNGTFFGSAGGYHCSDVLNMKTDSGAKPYLVMDAGKATPLYAYVKNVTAKQFYWELSAQVTGIRKDEKFPKFGMMIGDGKEMVKFYLDMTAEKQVNAVGAVHQKTGKEDDWAGQSTWNLNKKLDMSAGTVKLGLLRDGSRYYMYVNDRLVASGSDLSDRNAAMGVFSFGTSLKITNYQLVKAGADYDKLLKQAKLDADAFSKAALSENYFNKRPDGVYTLTTNSDASHFVDDVTVSGKSMLEANYSLKGKLSLKDADAWGQARILVSADPQNEYVIALEKLPDGNYQIFTMSNANESGWNNWTLIDDAEQNGSRNSIDFEIIAVGNRLYFLVDDALYYTDNRVAMSKSTVKFAGFNAGTTTVENIVLEVFQDAAAAQAYAATKADRFGENFGVSQGSYWTTNGVDLTGDRGEAPTLSITGGAPQYAYLRDVFTDKFCFETQLNVNAVLNDDGFPKFGVMTNDSTQMVKFFVDMTAEMTATHVGVVYQPTDGTDDWANAVSCNVAGMAFTGSDTVKLKLVREGKAYYFYVNDELVLYDEAGFAAEQGAVGIFSFNSALTASGYGIAIGNAADSAIAQAKEDVVELSKVRLSTNHFAELAEGVYTLTTDSDAENKVDDVLLGKKVLKTAHYSVKGKLSLENADHWGQARILISSDAHNEYVIALEKINTGNYQIFTMSKANEEGWTDWKLIESASHNGTRNVIDFEVIASGNQVYFLVGDEIYYSANRVSMSESTVKFTGYNVGTTKVENLAVEIFADSAEAERYIAGKDSRGGDNFGVSEGKYFTTDGVDLENDKGENPTVSFVGGAPQYAYLRELHTDKFCFETKVNVTDVLNNDGYPKFGMMVTGETQMVKFFVDMTPAMTASHVGVVYQPTGGADDWANSLSKAVENMRFTGADTVKLKLVREGNAYYFYVNDSLILFDENGFAPEKGAVGIFSFNTAMTISEYTLLTGADANSAIESAKAAMAELTKLGLTCNWFADRENGKYTLTTDSGAEHKVDDLTQGGSVLRTAYYSVKGKLTLTNAGDWGQARILVSADARNEYFIALERTAAGKYQIFTMSKANQTGWDKWELILHENTNGTRNSIDFELIVMGNKLYFLIDNTVVYTGSRVSMTQSTVKFTGYNVGTTTVEDLSAQVFKNQQEAESYLAEKN